MRSSTTWFLSVALLVGVSAGRVTVARSAWTPDGVPVSTAGSNFKPSLIPDGGGGSIIVWYGGANSDIFARRLLADGSVPTGWPANGPLGVCAAASVQLDPVLVSDLSGGALIFWQDGRNNNYDIYGQHLNATGQIVSTPSSNWVLDGLPISTAALGQSAPAAVSDGSGGAIVVWQDGRSGAGNSNIFVQRVDGDGNLLWGSGVGICLAAFDQVNPTIVSDGAHGAYVAWEDFRKQNESDIYVQHVTADGGIYPAPHWTADGLGACLASNSQSYPALAPDGSGGVFVSWQDFRSPPDNHIFAQHLSAVGDVVTDWPVDGRPVCQAPHSQFRPALASDGGTGVFVAWQDYRSGTSNDVYAQHLTAGNLSWSGDGVAISTAPNGQFEPHLAADGAGGAFVSWYDSRGGSTNDIYVQQVNSGGTLNSNWDRDGLGVCLAPNTQQFPAVVSSSRGAATVTWQDLRTGDVSTGAIFAQQALGTATAGVNSLPSPIASISSARPNPFHASAQFQLTLPAPAFVRAEVLDISGRRVMTIASRVYEAGVHSLVWDGTSARGGRAAPGVYLVRVFCPGLDKTQRVVRLQ